MTAKQNSGSAERLVRRLGRIALAGILLGLAFIFACNLWIIETTKSRNHLRLAGLPANDVGVVLGTARYVRKGEENPHFRNRIAAAAQLYQAGLVRHLLVSGTRDSIWHDEAREMRKALIALGVPDNAITQDPAGFRTLDSVVRASRVFGQNRITLISDEFHNYRALFLCDANGIDAVAYASADVALADGWNARVREVLARVKAVLDVYFIGKQPRELGEKRELNAGEN